MKTQFLVRLRIFTVFHTMFSPWKTLKLEQDKIAGSVLERIKKKMY